MRLKFPADKIHADKCDVNVRLNFQSFVHIFRFCVLLNDLDFYPFARKTFCKFVIVFKTVGIKDRYTWVKTNAKDGLINI